MKSAYQAEKIQECMSLSNHHLVLDPMLSTAGSPWSFFVGASHPFICPLKISDLICASLITLPRIGLVGAATFHWFGVACDRNARRKCSFATFRGLGGFGWWCWWVKEPWFQTSQMFAGWGPKSFKVKTSKPFFPFGHRPNLHAISILWQQLRFTQDMPVYRVHEAKPGQFGGHRNRFSSFHHWFLFRSYGSVNGNMSCSALNNPICIYVYNLWTYGSLVRSDFKHWLPMPGIIQVRNALRKKPYHLGIPRHSKLAQPMGMV